MSLKSIVNNFKRKKIQAGSHPNDFHTARRSELFPATHPDVDGEDCLHDCASCDINLPRGFKIDEEDELYGMVKGWEQHLIVATGKTDWVRDVADEAGSIMEAVEKGSGVPKPKNGRLMLSASNMPVPEPDAHTTTDTSQVTTTCLLLPSFTVISNVTPSNVPDLITQYIDPAPTNTTPLPSHLTSLTPSTSPTNGHHSPDLTLNLKPSLSPSLSSSGLIARPSPHKYLILLCSQKTRDARCGQSAPLLKREFERHLRPLGLLRDANDERPGGCPVVFISHVGGHKYSANCFVYRRAGSVEGGQGALRDDGEERGKDECGEAVQCIWLARVRPEDCENIVRYTVLQGKVVKPERQLRGGFDRAKGLVSW